MLRRGFFEHTTPDGITTVERLRRAGIAYRVAAENIQMSRGTRDPVRSAVDAWLLSDGHRRTMLDRRFTTTGMGVANDLRTHRGGEVLAVGFVLDGLEKLRQRFRAHSHS